MSLPAAAMAPDSGERNPILIGPWATASPTATSPARLGSSSSNLAIRMPNLPRDRALRPVIVTANALGRRG